MECRSRGWWSECKAYVGQKTGLGSSTDRDAVQSWAKTDDRAVLEAFCETPTPMADEVARDASP